MTVKTLIIDNNIDDRSNYKRYLLKDKHIDYDIDEFDLAFDALNEIEDIRYDLILSEYRLPDILGNEFVQKIRQHDHGKYSTIVIISKFEDQTVAVECMKKGANDYLLKDQLDKQNFLHSIHNALDVMALRKQVDGFRQQLMQTGQLAALGQMAAGIGHEINNPLMVISGSATQITKWVDSNQINPQKLKDCAEKIQEYVERASKITSGLRTFSGDIDYGLKSENTVKNLIDEALKFCREKFKARGIELSVNEFSEDLSISCQKVAISSVIFNLVNNAYDAVKTSAEKWVKIEVFDQGHEVKIKIIDSGKGVGASIQSKMMFPFFTTKAHGQGTGLGLSMSKGIIESHKGSLIYNEEHGHTAFTISLPKVGLDLEQLVSSF